MAKKKRATVRVPDVLWRLFRKRARTLSATITSLVLSPPQLLRSRDSSAFRDLLSHCFVVVSDDSSPPIISRLSPQSHWPQREIVARTIEMMISEKSVSSNVLCSGYDKYNQSSQLMDILTSPEWCLLLERVGEELMAFLLTYTSIFLPFNHKKYHQVAGSPITELCFNRSKHTFDARILTPQQIGHKKKRKREDCGVPLSKRQQPTSSLDSDGTLSSVTRCSGYSMSSLACDSKDEHSQTLEVATQITKNVMVNPNDNDNQGLRQNSNQSAKNVRKRSRPFLWQRHRKRKQLSPQETAVETPCQRPLAHENRLPQNCSVESRATFFNKKHPCSERKVPRHIAKGAEVNRKILFYNLEVSPSAFLRGHILNSLRPNTVGAMFLLKSIFGLSDAVVSSDMVPCFKHGDYSLSDSNSTSACLYHSLIKCLKILIHRAQRCQPLRFLNKHCAVQTHAQNAVCELEYLKENESQELQHLEGTASEAIKSYCQKSQVVSFVWAVCRSIVPSALLGTPRNWRILTENISKFVRLRRFEKFSLKQCMHKLKTSEFPLFSNKRSLCCLSNQVREQVQEHGLEAFGFSKLNKAHPIMKQRLIESWIYWFFSYLVVPLLKANFYVTESEHRRQEIFYYTKSVWGKVKKRAITALKDKSYVYLDDATARSIVKHRRFGFSKLRLLPKENGLRLLANLKAPSRLLKLDFCQENELFGACRTLNRVKKSAGFHHFKPVNSVLRDVYAVLRGMQLKEPEKLGSSVFDYTDVYRKLCPFLIGLKISSSAMPTIYLIASDVLKAFDSVDQNKLLSIVKDVLRQENYTITHSSEVRCTSKSLWVRENLALLDQNINSHSTSAIQVRSTDSILVNQECRKLVKKRELLFNLNEHVKRNILQLDQKFYLQRVGICQGSVLSSLLCSLYYGDMDNKVIFPFLERASQSHLKDQTSDGCQHASGAQITNSNATSNNSYMLLRFIDDFLFISTSKKQAESFISRLSRGFREYNCYMNKDKYSVNFDTCRVSELPSNRLCIGEDGVSFLRWSGLLINCCTLEVQADYTRYFNNHLSSSLTVSWQDKPGRRLQKRLRGFMRPKCHPLFYDSNINSAGVVRLNIFQSFLLCAMKFHCYLRDLSYIFKLNTRSYLRIIENSFRYMHFLIKKRMCSPNLGPDMRPILHLNDGEVEWLGLNAYVQVLNRKQSRYKKLLSLLKSKLLIHDLSWERSSELDYAVDAAHSALLWKIKY